MDESLDKIVGEVYGKVGRTRGRRLIVWCIQEFSEYGARLEWIVEGVNLVIEDRWWYDSDQRVLKGVRDYLHEVRGLSIPLRIGRYKKLRLEVDYE